MDGFLAGYWRLLRAIGTVERVVGVLLIANIVVNIVVNIGAQVFSRYLLDQPLVWVEELAVYSFIWGTFIGASLGLKELRHIRIASFVSALAPRAQHLMRALAWLIVLVLMGVLIVQAHEVMGIEGRSKSISLPVAVPRSWFYSIPLLVGCASMGLTCIYLILAELAAARTGRPVDADIAAGQAAEGAEL